MSRENGEGTALRVAVLVLFPGQLGSETRPGSKRKLSKKRTNTGILGPIPNQRQSPLDFDTVSSENVSFPAIFELNLKIFLHYLIKVAGTGFDGSPLYSLLLPAPLRHLALVS